MLEIRWIYYRKATLTANPVFKMGSQTLIVLGLDDECLFYCPQGPNSNVFI